MSISLTVVIDEITRERELLPENTCVIYIRDNVCGQTLLVNCGGSPSTLFHNCEKLNIDIEQIDVVVLTSVSVRYWSSLRSLLERSSKRSLVVYPHCQNFQKFNIEILCRRLGIKYVQLDRDLVLCNHIKLRWVNVWSNYAEIRVEIRNNGKCILINVPNLRAVADPDELLVQRANVRICSVPLSPLMLDYTTIIRRLYSRGRSLGIVYMCNPTPPEVRKELRDKCTNFRDSYVGLRLAL